MLSIESIRKVIKNIEYHRRDLAIALANDTGIPIFYSRMEIDYGKRRLEKRLQDLENNEVQIESLFSRYCFDYDSYATPLLTFTMLAKILFPNQKLVPIVTINYPNNFERSEQIYKEILKPLPQVVFETKCARYDQLYPQYKYTSNPLLYNKTYQRVVHKEKYNNWIVTTNENNIKEKAKFIVNRAYYNGGRYPGCIKVAYIAEGNMIQMIRSLKEEIIKIKVGDPMDPRTRIGPLLIPNEKQRFSNFKNIYQKSINGNNRNDGIYEYPLLIVKDDVENIIPDVVKTNGPSLLLVPIKGHYRADTCLKNWLNLFSFRDHAITTLRSHKIIDYLGNPQIGFSGEYKQINVEDSLFLTI